MPTKSIKIGYARVSTQDQNLDLQLRALKKAGCRKIFQEKASAVTRSRPEFQRMLDQLREGDVIVVWKLDRLARSTRDLLENDGNNPGCRRPVPIFIRAVGGYNNVRRQDDHDRVRRNRG